MTDWIDRFLAIGSTPNWISPLKGIIDDMRHGSPFWYTTNSVIWFHRSISVNSVKRALKKNNIDCWNDGIWGEWGLVTVAPEDLSRAQAVIESIQ